MKRRLRLRQMAMTAMSFGIAFDKDHPVHGGNHDKYFAGGYAIEVPRHEEIAEYTGRGILRTFEQLCLEASKEDHI
jgi:hypothetical protein